MWQHICAGRQPQPSCITAEQHAAAGTSIGTAMHQPEHNTGAAVPRPATAPTCSLAECKCRCPSSQRHTVKAAVSNRTAGLPQEQASYSGYVLNAPHPTLQYIHEVAAPCITCIWPVLAQGLWPVHACASGLALHVPDVILSIRLQAVMQAMHISPVHHTKASTQQSTSSIPEPTIASCKPMHAARRPLTIQLIDRTE
jgi:hypothetical protein